MLAEAILAETEGFEPSVGVIPLRRFSKPLVSATHPRLREVDRERGYRGGFAKVQPLRSKRATRKKREPAQSLGPG